MTRAQNRRTEVPREIAQRIASTLESLEAATLAHSIPVTGDGRVSEGAAALLLGVAAGTLRNRRGEDCPLPFYRVAGGRVTYRLADLAALIESSLA